MAVQRYWLGDGLVRGQTIYDKILGATPARFAAILLTSLSHRLQCRRHSEAQWLARLGRKIRSVMTMRICGRCKAIEFCSSFVLKDSFFHD